MTDSLSTKIKLQKPSNEVSYPCNFPWYHLKFEQIILAPFNYIESLPSKRVSERFIDALNIWFAVPEQIVDSIKYIASALVTSSMMLDDIEDNSTLRRGKPAAHVIYGASQTVNSANYAYVHAVAELGKLEDPACFGIFIDETENLHIGQSLDLHWRYHNRCPSIDEYMTMISNKTGGFFRLMVRLMQAESTLSKENFIDLSSFTTLIGSYYQIRDDFQNLDSQEYAMTKGYCSDLDEGKFSLPLIHCLSTTPNSSEITGILQHKPPEGLSMELKAFILEHMKETGSLEYTRGLLKDMECELREALKGIEENFGVENEVLGGLLGRLRV
ncbi:hypothetical protein B7494_g1208 [Chlorociboria aeruginascens]|nr:hypothetical protein B7494_g1208 [Chlorociboria aeruginascens]